MTEEAKTRSGDEDGNEMDDIGTCLTPAAVCGLYEFHQEQKKIHLAGEDEGKRRATLLEHDLGTLFPEDWQISQFWYDEETTRIYSDEIRRLIIQDGESRVAFISCPSVFRQCYNPNAPDRTALFEFDKRFSAYGKCFHFYDYKLPEDVGGDDLIGAFSIVMLDPPFLSIDCLAKMAKTVQLLGKPGLKILLSTGGLMEEGAKELLGLQKVVDFVPKHTKAAGIQLKNQFSCFTNYDFRGRSRSNNS